LALVSVQMAFVGSLDGADDNDEDIRLVILFTLGILAVRFAPSEPPVDQVPDREGKLTFHGPDYQLRAPRDQVALVSVTPHGSQRVDLSVDRREFGSPDAPGPPRIVCTSGGSCGDSCAGTENVPPPICYDLENGWYRVMVAPISEGWGGREWLIPPRNAGPGFRCGDDGHSGLEFCWDRARFTPSWPIANVHDVPYEAIRQSAAATWVSIARDADGLPTFHADCPGRVVCSRFIEKAGARIELDFPFAELDNWQRLETGLRGFADRLILPSPSQKWRHYSAKSQHGTFIISQGRSGRFATGRARSIGTLRAPSAAASHRPQGQFGAQATAQKDQAQAASRHARQNTSLPRRSGCPKIASPLAQMHHP
jgi:hypothetical protein